jgi:uncharacterized coiled-coil DUF342 family protein
MTRNYYQDKIDYLEKIAEINSEIDRLILEMDMWRTKATNITTDITNEPVQGGVSDKVGNSVAKILEINEKIDKKIDKLVDLKEEIKSKINKIDDVRYRNVLKDRYICLMTWDSICKKNEYSWRYIFKLRDEALKKFEL